MSVFADARAVARYTEGPVRQVPGFLAMQRMAMLLLAERVPEHGRVLVLGAGGGLELKVFADAHPRWRLLGVDPSAPMLALARETLGAAAGRVELLQGCVDDAPDIRFDGATCLLTLHFLDQAQRLRTLQELRRRLVPGAPLVVAHHSVPREPARRQRWLERYAAFASPTGRVDAQARRSAEILGTRLPMLAPEEDAALLERAGFIDPELFYAGFTFRGWVAYAP